MKQEDTIVLPGFVLINCNAGRTVSAVEYVVQLRRESATPILLTWYQSSLPEKEFSLPALV